VWERLKARWRHYQQQREEEKLLAWRTNWRPTIWSAFVPMKYLYVPHPAVKRRVAAIIMPVYRTVYYRPDLTLQDRRLTGAMALAALKRVEPTKPYVILMADLRSPEGPEDNQHWVDWLVALEYLAPLSYVEYLATRYPDKVELYLEQIFDLSPGAVKQRLNERNLHKAWTKSALFQPNPVRLPE
jgi:hypothetical protein